MSVLKKIWILKINKLLASVALVSISSGLFGCSAKVDKNGTPALFNTKAEAEKAAKNFNCTGAHRMGDKWMPCQSNKVHEKSQKLGVHEHQHNH